MDEHAAAISTASDSERADRATRRDVPVIGCEVARD